MRRLVPLVLLLAGCSSPPTLYDEPASPAGTLSPRAWSISCSPAWSEQLCVNRLEAPPTSTWVVSVSVHARDGTLVVARGLQTIPFSVDLMESHDAGRTWRVEPVGWTGLLDGIQDPVDVSHPLLWADAAGNLQLMVTVSPAGGDDPRVLHLQRSDGGWRAVHAFPGARITDDVAWSAGRAYAVLREHWAGTGAQVWSFDGAAWSKAATPSCRLHANGAPSDLTRIVAADGGLQSPCGGESRQTTRAFWWNATSSRQLDERIDRHGCGFARWWDVAGTRIVVAGDAADVLHDWCGDLVRFDGITQPASRWGAWTFDEKEIQIGGLVVDDRGTVHLTATERHRMQEAAGSVTGLLGSRTHLLGLAAEGPVYHHLLPLALDADPREGGVGGCMTRPWGELHVQFCAGQQITWWFLVPA